MLRKILSIIIVIIILSVILQIPLLDKQNNVNQNSIIKILVIINDFVVALGDIVLDVLIELGNILKDKIV